MRDKFSYKIGGRWVGETEAENTLRSAADTLARSPFDYDRNIATRIKRGLWREIAARPSMSADVMERWRAVSTLINETTRS